MRLPVVIHIILLYKIVTNLFYREPSVHAYTFFF